MLPALIPERPRPPLDLLELGEADRFVPAPDLAGWIRRNYLASDGPLFGAHHGHLETASIGVLWTNADNTRHGKRIVAQAEMPLLQGNAMGNWRRARNEQQLREWFGAVPVFLLTFEAFHAAALDNAAFAALVDHELTHCAQATDSMGFPAFVKATGEPKFALRGHDVEEFTSVVERFGIEAAGAAAVEFVIAAAQKPTIAKVKIANACGTCLRLAA